jgi:hypothetical protein
LAKFQPIQNFDGLSPQTTKGDLISRTTTGAVAVPVGANNTVLTADSGQASGVKWASATANLPVNTLTGPTTLPATSQVLLVSGTTFAITFPSAASNSGLQYQIMKTDGLLTPISITGTGVAGATLCSEKDEITYFCDGTTFWPFNHRTATGATNVGGMTILAITTAPTKGTSLLSDKCIWWREGQFCVAYYEYQQQNAGAAGSGNYLFSLPGNISLDTSLVALSTTVSTISENINHIGIFNGIAAGTNQGTAVYAVPYTATQFRLCGLFGGAANTVTSGAAWSLNNTTVWFGGWIKFPVAGWSA